MKNIKHILEDMKNVRPSLSTYFAFLTSILMVIIMLTTIGYIMRYVRTLSFEYSDNIKTSNYVVSSLIFQGFQDAYTTDDYSKIDNTTSLMKTNKMLSYAYAVDKNTNRVIWATEERFINKTTPLKLGSLITGQGYRLNEIQEVRTATGDYEIYLGLSKGQGEDASLQLMFDNMKVFILIFIFIGIMASAIMSQLIIKRPLTDLIKGVKEFAKGNLDFRLQKTKYLEINELVQEYNAMADQLHDSYASLEQKVKERTIELEKANREIKEAQSMVVHSEKMRSLGELVAGIAHEINNPINFIYGNIMILDKYSKDMLELINKYIGAEENIDSAKRIDIEKFKAEIDLDFLQDDISELIRSCIEGTERTKNIILDLKNFSRMEEMVMSQIDVQKEIETTLNILSNKYKNRITIHQNYSPDVPKIEGFGGQLNQVFMNILDNAQGAIEKTGDVYIDVTKDGENVVITFKDTGCGIKKENISKVFDPFFTTKSVGQGTGLGMSITYRVIQNHYGKIDIESEVGQGATFRITLPINHADNTKA